MDTLLYIISGLVLMIVWHFVTKHIQFKRFRRTMRPGVECWYYEGEDRLRCVIAYIVSDRVLVKNEYGELVQTTKDNLYV